MKRRMLSASLLTTILMLASFSPSFAKEPVVETTEEYGVESYTLCSEWFQGEYDFDIIYVSNTTVRVTTFFDEDGNPKEYQAFVKWDGTMFRSDKPDQTYKDMVRETVKGELPSGVDHKAEAIAGFAFNLTLPGEGRVASAIGRIVFDENGTPVFAAGLWRETPKDLCEVFSEL